MDETKRDSRYLSSYGLNQGYGSTQRPEVSVHNVAQTHSQQIVENYVDEDDDDEEQEADGGDNEIDGQDDDDNGNTDNDKDNDDDDDDGDDMDNFNLHRHPKKRKLKSLSSSFELVPHVPPPQPLAIAPPQQPPPAATKPSFGGRNTLTDWTEHETFVLLESWGQRFLQRGRKSLRSEEWQEVAEKVSQKSKTKRTDTQCRNRLDTLKKKYKKEKALLQTVKKPVKNVTSKWIYFKKMDTLMSSTPQQSGEHVDRSNRRDETRDHSPGNADSQDSDDDDSDLLPLKKSKVNVEKVKGEKVNKGSVSLLAESINKFSDIYEKIENGKRKQMFELEKMRMDFHKELELQKKQILEQARDEIAKIRRGDYEENDSTENISR